MRKLVFFNHKGGVGKTTLTFHVAAILGKMGKRVLLVDADPQCNLSSYVIDESTLDRMLDRSETATGRTLWTALRPVVSGTGQPLAIAPLELVTKGVSILPGDIRLFDYESALADLWAECARRRERGFIGVTALRSVVDSVCSSSPFDYVMFDVGPNIGPLNRSIVLDCDALVVPAGCDLFSSRALKTLGAALSSWLTEWNAIASLAPTHFPKLNGSPELLGYSVQRFKLYGKTPTTEATKYMSLLQTRVPADLVAVVRDAPSGRVHANAGKRPLGEIKEFNRLAAISQTSGIPVFDLNEATDDERSTLRGQFEKLVKRLMDRLGDRQGGEPTTDG